MAVIPSQDRVILDEQDGQGQEQKTHAREESLEGGQRFGIGQNDEDHHEITYRFDPPLEGNIRVVGPGSAKGAVDKEQEDRPVGSQESSHLPASADKHE